MEDFEDVTPTRAIREGFRWFPAVVILGVLASAVIAVLVIGWLFLGWFTGQQAANRDYSITVHSQGYQTTLIQTMTSRLQDISDIGVTRSGEPANSPMQAPQRAQQLSALRTFCTDAAQLTSGNPAASQLYPIAAANCLAGTVIPNPPLVK